MSRLSSSHLSSTRPSPAPPLPGGIAVTEPPVTRTPAAPAAPAAPISTDAPTEAELLAFVRTAAADSALVDSLPLDPEGRTWLRLEGPGGSEAWIIGWPPGTGTGWHDHGGSRGAFATARGSLTERSLAARIPTEGWRTLELAEGVDRERRLSHGRGRAFGPHHVHEVVNEAPAPNARAPRTHAVSVHAYYPPLPLMRRYSRTGAVLRLEQTEQPGEWE